MLYNFMKNGEVCPANWNKGDQTMSESPESLQSYFQSTGQKETIKVG